MRRLALLAALVPMLTAAQSAPLGTEQGFFKPTPDGDPSLTRARPQDAQAQRAPFAAVQPQPGVQPVQSVQPIQPVQPMPVLVTPEGTAVGTVRTPEEELDGSKREAEEARVRALHADPAPDR